MRLFLPAALCAAVLCVVPARADTTTALSNVLAAEQIVDSVETAAFLRVQNCITILDPQVPYATHHRCIPANGEVDPLARPFAHSLPLALLAATAVNFGVRKLGERSAPARYFLGAVVIVYPLLLEHNARLIHATLSVKF